MIILASCMHAGSRMVRLSRSADDEDGDSSSSSSSSSSSKWSFEVLGMFEEHESMNYGSDVQPGGVSNVKTIVSTSFYDKLLCVWRFDVGDGQR